MNVKVYIYTRKNKKKSALESNRPTEIYVVNGYKVKKVYEKQED